MVWLSSDLRFKWFGYHPIWHSNGFGCQLIRASSDLDVKWLFKWFGCQLMCDSNDFGCHLIWDSSELVVNWFEIQLIWLSTGLGFSQVGDFLFCETSFKSEALKLQNAACLRDFLQIWNYAAQKQSFSARLPSNVKLWSSKTKLVCQTETSFTNNTLKLKNEAFVRDFLQKWSFETKKRSFSARLPSKIKVWISSISARLPSKINRWRSTTKHFCETSFKNRTRSKTKLFCQTSFKKEVLKINNKAFVCETSIKNQGLKPKNEAFVRDFLQKWSFEAQKRTFCARLPSKMKLWSSKTKLLRETYFKNEALKLKNESFLRDFLQKWYVDQTLDRRSTIHFRAFSKWMLRKYCACHEKVEPRHTNSCSCYAKWSLL